MLGATTLVWTWFLSFAVTAILTPAVRRIAIARGALDDVGSRRVHGRPVPRLGGIAIVVGFYSSLVATVLAAGRLDVLEMDQRAVLGLSVAGLGIALLGIYDDLRGANAYQKFTVQIAAGVVLYVAGFRADVIATPFGASFSTGVLALPITVVWIVGVTNAVNLIDGLDGLAGGVSVIATAAIVVIGARSGGVGTIIAATALAGAAVGFLVYNVAPASIFMGDTGSLFLGTMLGALGLNLGRSEGEPLPLIAMALVLGLPLLDTSLAMLRRASRGVPMFRADREHLHHRLLAYGLSQRRTVVALWAVSALLAGVGVQMASGSPVGLRTALFLAVVLGTLVALSKLGQLAWFERDVHLRRRRNRRRFQQLRAVTNRLVAARTVPALCRRIQAAAAPLGADRVALRLGHAVAAGSSPGLRDRDGRDGRAGTMVGYPIDRKHPRRGVLEVTWSGAPPAERDAELAIEILCQVLARVVHRFEPRLPAGVRAAVVRSSARRAIARMRRERRLAAASRAASPNGRVLFVVNDAAFFLRHFGMLAHAVAREGYEVHVASPGGSEHDVVTQERFVHHALRLERTGRNPLHELRTFADLFRLARQLRPTLVHLITIKPVLYGGLVSRLAGIPSVLFTVTGLGSTYLARGVIASAQRSLIWRAYRLAFRHRRSRVIVQNQDDGEILAQRAMVPRQRVELVRGLGIDLAEFTVRPEPPAPPVIILPARMLWDKGVAEFVEAAAMLRRLDVQARFVLVGSPAPGNPRSIPVAQLEAWVRDESIEWWGHREDMPAVFASAHIVCLPSWYREGIPRALIEAAACGRPIVTTDAPGCRDVVRHGVNGFLVPPRRSAPVAAALERLIFDPALRLQFGERGHELVVSEMNGEDTIAKVLGLYRDLTGRPAVPAGDPLAPPRPAPLRPAGGERHPDSLSDRSADVQPDTQEPS